ncbi:hypothetical protein FA95DRAFT_1599051 [Auriscalpium vulgare]|uniref:Uncharacterized protein n=1 Tax=Auriscalpium vulgare TaxID=40419 RepID=A0ACB8RCE7_9AGAM|nr:hypothetical protein FA95DRAFT_1599051 [Auriscalpium vulgare]
MNIEIPSASAEHFWLSATHARVSHLRGPGLRSEEDAANFRKLLLLERDALQAAMRSINAEINTLCPISRLPPELLALVFSQLVKDETAECLRLHESTALKWTSVTRVCHQWRQTAFQQSHLWRHIVLPFSSESLLDEFISRSNNAPLVLSWISKSRGPHRRPFLWHALKTMDRVERISIVNFDGNVPDLCSLLVTPAPLLEAVDVGMHFLASEPIHLPSTLFADHAPRLRHISLRNVAPFPWSSSFPNIVSLKLTGASITPPPVPRLLESLRKMPLLEVLQLEHCLPVFPQGVSADDDMVAPGHLKKLSLYDDLEKCVGFLQHLRMPQSSVMLHLNCKTEGDATAFRALYPHIAAAYSPQQITSLKAESFYVRAIEFSSYRGDAENIWETRDLSLSFWWEDLSAGRTVYMLQELVKVVGIRELRHLHLDLPDSFPPDPPDFTESLWLDVFAACPLLVSINVENESAISLCRALATVTVDGVVWQRNGMEDSHSNSTGALVWPDLRVISLSKAPMKHVYDDGRSLHKVFAQFLRDRNALKCPVDTLDLNSCSVKPRWLRRFEDIVENVIGWDDSDDEDFEFVDSVENSEDDGDGAAS